MGMSKKHGYWIHHRKPSDTVMGGYLYLPACDCSECGHTVNIEKSICPYCGTIMDRTAPADQEGPIEGEPETDKKD